MGGSTPPSGQALEFRSEVARLEKAYEQAPSLRLAIPLFQALGWDSDDYQIQQAGANGIEHYRLTVLGETAAYLFVAKSPPETAHVREAARVAYNSGVDWVTFSDFGRTIAMHARWPDEPSFLTLGWRQYRRRLEELMLLSPAGVIEGHLARLAREKQGKRYVLSPVDEDLMRNLDTWRRLLVRSSRDVNDEDVHELLGRLLFIRGAEDRGLLEKYSLRNMIEGSGAAKDALSTALDGYFRKLSRGFNSELFTAAATPAFDDSALRDIIRRLYEPFPGLPQYSYDFSHVNVDVLGRVYERYVSTVLEPSTDPLAQTTLFPVRNGFNSVEVRSKRREQGIYYTPAYVVDYIVDHAVQPLLRGSSSLNDFPVVADISCGSGSFLTRAGQRLLDRAKDLSAGDVNVKAILEKKLIGVDIDPRATTLARVNLWTLANSTSGGRLPSLHDNVFVDDALFSPRLDDLRGKIDVLIGNPPFRSAVELDRTTQERLRGRYRAASGRFDVSYIFVERALELVRPGGMIGLVIPNRLFSNVDARFVRELLSEACEIQQVIDFGHLRAFNDVLAYIAILVLRRKDGETRQQRRVIAAKPDVQVQRIIKLGQYPALQLRQGDLHAGERWKDAMSVVFSSLQPKGSGPWIWGATDVEDRVIEKLRIAGNPLGDFAEVRQGVKTGDNDLLLLRRISDAQNGLWLMRNGLDEPVPLDPEMLRTSAHRGVIDRYNVRLDGDEYVLYPYSHDRLLSVDELQDRYPATYTYLVRHRDRLAKRSTVLRRGAWWDLSWPRAPELINGPKVIGRQLTSHAVFGVDRLGTIVPIGGTFIVPTDRRIGLDLLLALLNSALTTWQLARHGAAFQQGYFEVTRSVLMRVALPWEALLEQQLIARRIADLAKGAARSAALGLSTADYAREIDNLLFDIVGFDAEERAELLRLAEAHYQTPDTDPWSDVRRQPQKWQELLTVALGRIRRASSEKVGLERSLIGARDDLYAAIRQANNLPEPSASLLTFAYIAVEQLSRGRPDESSLATLTALIEAAGRTEVDWNTVNEYLARLADIKVEILPTMRGASVLLGPHPDDDDFGAN